MKQIIDNKLYDTETATKIYKYKHRYFEQSKYMPLGWGFTYWEKAEIYKTKKGNYFIYYYDENNSDRERIEIRTEEEIKVLIQELNVDEYIKLFRVLGIEEA